MTKFLSFFAATATVLLLAMSSAYAEAQCSANDEGFLPCAEGQLSADADADASLSENESLGAYTRHPRHPRRYPRPPHRPPHYPPHYPPPAYPHYPAPFCYTPSGFCRMVVATPPGVSCTCNFGYYWDSGVTGY